MKTTLKDGKDEIVLELAIKLQKGDKVVLNHRGVKQVKKIDREGIVILGKSE